MSVINAIRYTRQALKDWGTAQGVEVGFKALRDPLTLADDDEKVILRVAANRSVETRNGQKRTLLVFEFHCMSKRGELRDDGRFDRAEVLGSMIEEEFLHKDIDIYDVAALNGGAGVKIGSLQFLESRWRNGASRGTIYQDGVDYTLEQPKNEHWVVSMTAALNA